MNVIRTEANGDWTKQPNGLYRGEDWQSSWGELAEWEIYLVFKIKESDDQP